MQRSRWILPIITVRGVPIQLHLSFLLLIAWVVLGDEGDPLLNVLFVLAVFLCVLLHECGHVFTGQSLGIKTRDITLYPFGGVATLLSQPTASKEFLIAIAGPIVNVVIAAIIFPFTGLESISDFHSPPSFLSDLYRTNLALAGFNLIPALPMDGGRILRSLLAMLRIENATKISARISQVLSLALGALGIFYFSPMLTIIGVLVFYGAIQEMTFEKTKRVVTGRTVRDLMTDISKLYVLHHGETLSHAVSVALRSSHHYIPVLYNNDIIGLVERDYLLANSITSEEEQYVGSIMERDFVSIDPEASLEEALSKTDANRVEVLVVKNEDKFLGLLFRSQISDLMIVDSFRHQRNANDSTHPIPDDS